MAFFFLVDILISMGACTVKWAQKFLKIFFKLTFRKNGRKREKETMI